MKRTSLFACAIFFILISGLATANGQNKKVLIIGVDGLRPDALELADTPNIDALIANGTYAPDSTTSDATFSGPGWTDVLFGIHRNDHAVNTNETSPNPFDSNYEIFSNSNQHLFPDALAIVNTANPALKTARFVGNWIPLFTTRSPAGSEFTFQGTDSAAMNSAVDFYTLDDADIGFIYLANPDTVGHTFGFNPTVPQYVTEIENTDARVGQVVSAIQARPGFMDGTEDWVFILVSDHGGDLYGTHSGNRPWHRRVPFVVSGNSVVKQRLTYGTKNVDVVPTALAHMGIALPDHLVGHVVGLVGVVDPRPEIGFDVNLVFNGDAEYDEGFTDHAMDQAITGWNEFPDADYVNEISSRFGAGTATILEYGSPGGFPTVNDPGPGERGSNFFSSGESSSTSEMIQQLDLSSLAQEIDARIVDYELSAYLGGFGSQDDRADFAVRFYAADASTILSTGAVVGPGASERNNTTGLYNRVATGDVPVGARFVEFVFSSQGNKGFADNLSFVAFENCEYENPPITPTPGTTEWRFEGNTNSMVGPGTLTAQGDAVNTDSYTTAMINEQPASVLNFTPRQSIADGYTVRPRIDGSLDGGDPDGIEQFTMIMDIRYIDESEPYIGIWNGSANNINDSEFFIRPSTGGFWTPTTGSIGDGTLSLNQFHRIVYVNDYTNGVTEVYVDGVIVFTTEPVDYVGDGDPSPFWILTDNTPSETGSGQIAAFAFVDKILSAEEIADLGGPKSEGIFVEQPPANRFHPQSFSTVRGLLVGGQLPDTFESDDSYLRYRPGLTLMSSEPQVWVAFESTLGSDSPAALNVAVEASANTFGITQTIDMFNWTTGRFSEIDSRDASFNIDSVACAAVLQDVTSFVQSGTGLVKARIGWRASGLVLLYPWTVRIDEVVWTTGN